MSPSRLISLISVIGVGLGAAACGAAGVPKPRNTVSVAPSEAATLPALPRSSIAAVLEHRTDLKLTDDQVEHLLKIDQDLAVDEERLLEEDQKRHAPPPTSTKPHSKLQPIGANGAGTNWGAGQFGSGNGGGGGHHGGRHSGASGVSTEPNAPKNLTDQLDDLDTHAYLRAESEVLTEAQREPARDVAEQYRETLYDRRAKAAADQGDSAQ